VEAGKLDMNPIEIPIVDISEFVDRSFRPLAEEKGLSFKVDVMPDLPPAIVTDGQRLQQVLKNLLSNALKFTHQGGVTLTIRRAEKDRRFATRSLDVAPDVIAFAVSDTGIGIPKDKQQLIFEAFQQADGSTSRKYGGTGLGLSISREITRLLGGEIRVESAPGKGSTFTLFLPGRYVGTGQGPGPKGQGTARPTLAASRQAEAAERTDASETVAVMDPPARELRAEPGAPHHASPVGDDRAEIQPGDRSVLIVENDPNFARILLNMAREKEFKGIIALDGESAIDLAHAYHPDAVTLDIDLPGMDGWAVLDRLKHHPDTRHIPVHVISGISKRQRGLKAGAIAYLEKPVSKEALDDAFGRIQTFLEERVRRLLVVEDDETQRNAIIELVGAEDVTITAVASAEDALRELASTRYDCMVLDLGLHDMSGFDLLERVKGDATMSTIPIIIYTGKELSPAEETRLRKYAETIIVKDVKSPERLLDETALFLHRVEAKLPDQKRRMLEQLHTADSIFAGKKVLIVDDDVRNIFSLTSMLEDHGMHATFVENGQDAIAALDADSSIDLVLMDIMMPGMDGYETTQAIRQNPRFKSLPIIALTAKAMKGDREKTLAAGASDYITKPVDPEQLLSLMRVWLYK
jgi:CheY-like chemotaxis protein/two-component sensor histidine kinase